MTKTWQQVKDRIEDELDAIMWDEPIEATMARHGVFPSGAGTDGQYFGNLFYLCADLEAMSWWTVTPAMRQALADPELSVDHCRRFWRYMFLHMGRLMGDEAPPNCPAPWLNLGTLTSICNDIDECLDSIQTKQELTELFWSWSNYAHRLALWFFLIFPWELGQELRSKSKAEVEVLVESGVLPVSVLAHGRQAIT